ncbi:SLC13 family permease [Desulfobotulus mexicanus]|uniref:SLC13/DASS family transporter n=1 Tax=Desulfobotulus mexicanus TaxID=2586642 RepID=A0A5Q4VIV4_9BACT|nr:SLC13 family permease [Desulfobotulus mexicanus]TYT76080.1 SLC13/DASS family transporter [Desulfobotulus mexicanus]
MSASAAVQKAQVDYKRLFFMFLGLFLFCIVYWAPPFPDAIDPMGASFSLSPQAKGAIAIFLLAGTWWVFEVVPIGITSILIGVMQVMFHVRSANDAFKDFMTPSVMFIFASLIIGIVFTKTGLTKRIAYKMLAIVGEKTHLIMLGCFLITVALTHFMAHTAVAATMYPLLLAVYAMYSDDPSKPTNFGKGLFIGMAYVAGAGSIVTLLGAARAPVALGFYKDIVGREISFFELTYYMAPIGWLMAFLIWGMMILLLPPEKKKIDGVRERAAELAAQQGGITSKEIIAASVVITCIAIMSLGSFIPALGKLDKTGLILITTLIFFTTRILTIEDLESVPWNIILLFGGAMSIGFCLWQTGAAQWMAVHWLTLFEKAHWFVFVMGMAVFVLAMTNFIMNVAAIAISMPVALVIAPYLNVAPEVITFAALVTAGMPFLLLVGAAPNAIAYNSGQFTTGEFFKFGIIASILLLAVLSLFILVIWPLMGMPVSMLG